MLEEDNYENNPFQSWIDFRFSTGLFFFLKNIFTLLKNVKLFKLFLWLQIANTITTIYQITRQQSQIFDWKMIDKR